MFFLRTITFLGSDHFRPSVASIFPIPPVSYGHWRLRDVVALEVEEEPLRQRLFLRTEKFTKIKVKRNYCNMLDNNIMSLQ